MSFLKKIWGGIKSGFNWIKEHKTISFLVGGTVIGTALGMTLGFGFLPSLGVAAAATAGLFAAGGLVFGAGVLVGGLVLLAGMGIANLFGLGKKDEPQDPPAAVATEDPAPVEDVELVEDGPGVAPAQGIADAIGGDGAAVEVDAGAGQGPTAVDDVDVTLPGADAVGQAGQAAEGPSMGGLSQALGDDAEPVEVAPMLPVESGASAPVQTTGPQVDAMPATLPSSAEPKVDLELGQPVG